MMTITCIVAAFTMHPHSSFAFNNAANFLSRTQILTKSHSFNAKLNNVRNSFSFMKMTTSSASSSEAYIRNGISRIETLQTLLSLHGAPGSSGCAKPDGDLEPIPTLPFYELVKENKELLDLHPQLYPIAKSKSTGNYICALRRPSGSSGEPGGNENDDNDENPNAPLPLVEGGIGLPGMKLLSLNSELLMRRIAAEADDAGGDKGAEIVHIYNTGLGEGKLKDAGLDTKYEVGSVAKLGYGADKYVLLRVGPFPDLYESMSNQHAAKNDESSCLIAAEASNGKFTGFGSTFAFYAKVLSTLPNREEETKDAARVCLRLPISSIALTKEELAEVAVYAGLAGKDDDVETSLQKMLEMYEKIRKHEQEENSDSGKTAEQIALDEANYILDEAALTGKKWSETRKNLAEIYEDAGKDNMAKFVNPE